MRQHAERSLIADAGFDITNLAFGDFPRESASRDELARLRLANLMHSTLQVDEVLHTFVSEVQRSIRRFSFRYRNREEDVIYDEGRAYAHRANYHIDLHGTSLGHVTISRCQPFTPEDLRLFESMLCTLVHPLRNALLHERALRSATIDPLTGVQNRNGLRQHLDHQVLLAARHGTPICVMMIDIDFFKAINDTHGHATGDHVLVETVRQICAVTRNSDVVFRYGGEEFVVVLSNTTLAGGRRLAERVRESVRKSVAQTLGSGLAVTVSIGVSDWQPDDSATTLLHRADSRLYRAKHTGRDRVVCADEPV